MVNLDDKYVQVDAVTQSAAPGELLICITNQMETANLRMSSLKTCLFSSPTSPAALRRWETGSSNPDVRLRLRLTNDPNHFLNINLVN